MFGWRGCSCKDYIMYEWGCVCRNSQGLLQSCKRVPGAWLGSGCEHARGWMSKIWAQLQIVAAVWFMPPLTFVLWGLGTQDLGWEAHAQHGNHRSTTQAFGSGYRAGHCGIQPTDKSKPPSQSLNGSSELRKVSSPNPEDLKNDSDTNVILS